MIISRWGYVNCSLTPLDLFLWGFLKSCIRIGQIQQRFLKPLSSHVIDSIQSDLWYNGKLTIITPPWQVKFTCHTFHSPFNNLRKRFESMIIPFLRESFLNCRWMRISHKLHRSSKPLKIGLNCMSVSWKIRHFECTPPKKVMADILTILYTTQKSP